MSALPILPELRAATTAWRCVGTLSLTSAIRVAEQRHVVARVTSVETAHPHSILVEICGAAPSAVIVSVGARARERRSCSIREVGDSAYESVATVSCSQTQLSLSLTVGSVELSVPIVSGNDAALISHGWSEDSIGRSAELRVPGPALNVALHSLLSSVVDRSILI